MLDMQGLSAGTHDGCRVWLYMYEPELWFGFPGSIQDQFDHGFPNPNWAPEGPNVESKLWNLATTSAEVAGNVAGQFVGGAVTIFGPLAPTPQASFLEVLAAITAVSVVAAIPAPN